MIEFKKNGLVIHEYDLEENDKLLIILTEKFGKVPVIVKGGKSLKNRHLPCCQLFAYSSFSLRKRGNYYYIVESDLIESYFNVRTDIIKFALASYICEVANDVCQEGNNDDNILRLLLNTLHLISNDIKPLEFIRASFEMRMCYELGFAPNIEQCSVCGNLINSDCFLDIFDGVVICSKCREQANYSISEINYTDQGVAKPFIQISSAVVQAILYIVNAKPERFTAFNIENSELDMFYNACEKFLLNHLERGFTSLDFYKSVI
ncbi:MAG: DNA repair protein RecO [Clostridia bacterium]|nr:DNA repair protein RecO [Clostridia bacterium]